MGPERSYNIYNLVHDNGEFFSQDEFDHMFNIKTNFVQYEGCSNMNASSFITFVTYMLRQNG